MNDEGRQAWSERGVSARNPYRFGTHEWLRWDEGYSEAMWAAKFAAQKEAVTAFYA